MAAPADRPSSSRRQGPGPRAGSLAGLLREADDKRHTYKRGCRLAPVPHSESDPWLEGIPAMNAQFFYSSTVSIDDPLAAGNTDSRPGKMPPMRPFSQGDNNMLEKAWLGLGDADDRHNHKAAQQGRQPAAATAQANEKKLAAIVHTLARQHVGKHAQQEPPPVDDAASVHAAAVHHVGTAIAVCCEQLPDDVAAALAHAFCPVARGHLRELGVDKVVQRVMAEVGTRWERVEDRSAPRSLASSVASRHGFPLFPPLPPRLGALPSPSWPPAFMRASSSQPGRTISTTTESGAAHARKRSSVTAEGDLPGLSSTATAGAATSAAIPVPVRVQALDDGMSRKPFLRVGTPETPRSTPPASSLPRFDSPGSKAPLVPATPSTPVSSSVPAAVNVSPSGVSDSKYAGTSVPAAELSHGDSKEAGDGNDSKNSRNSKNGTDDATAAEPVAPGGPEELQVPELAVESLGELRPSAEVAVGVSRLHMVYLPALQMKPIYWSPVNDIAVVQRASWFYKENMMPLEPTLANQLESYYRELRPWTDLWAEELRCAVEVGAAGEEKVTQPVWPKPAPRPSKKSPVSKTTSKPAASQLEPTISNNRFCASRCHHGIASAEGTLDPEADEGSDDAVATAALAAAAKSFANFHVIYKDGRDAFLLKPSLAPSAYYKRRPIAKIFRGATVGIPVVRGFDRDAWDTMYQKPAAGVATQPHDFQTLAAAAMAAHSAAQNSRPEDATEADSQAGSETSGAEEEEQPPPECPGCLAAKKQGQVTDLVLVAHGVGQKLAERVESFHFTHAINSFRRAVNTELATPVVQSVVRPDQNGIMVLPVNWRHTLSFEDGGMATTDDRAAFSAGFGLKNIEPDTIPAVRSMISDVMFDIPFYMSHHKPKMITALVREANRVYRLWCLNNPGFEETGRVHIIGHSLGSAMAIDVLSRQPTVPPPLDLAKPAPESKFFEFDTKNLFLLGSPSAFFLLLERGALIPRLGRRKPGIDASDSLDSRVCGQAGTFGCLAVDNIFNILAKEDPIAYLLNGTIDTAYATSLKTAYVPSATAGFFKSIGDSLRGAVPGMAAPSPYSVAPLVKPPAVTRLPSQLELEVHDFTREEIAERKAFLLNDNGQIDYYLQSGGGPLEIQYLNMLSAHTSYWTNPDLIRMLCMEIGRRPGKANSLFAMRAVKATKKAVRGNPL